MAKKETKKAPISKKEQELLKTQIIETVTEEAKEEIASEVKSKITKTFDEEYKEELKFKISQELSDDIKKDVERETKRRSRKKSFKIFRLSLYILILLALIGYGIYRLYITDNINILNYKYKNTTKEVKVDEEETTARVTTTTKSQEELLKEYSYLLDNVIITNPIRLQSRLVIKDLPIDEKLAMAYKTLDISDINVSGRIYTIEKDTMKKAYSSLFGSDDDYSDSDFNIDGFEFVYQDDKYIAIKTNNNVTLTFIDTSITSIKEKSDAIEIKAYVAVVKGKDIYNYNDLNTPIATYNGKVDFDNVKASLKESTFVFRRINLNYYLESIN